MCVFESFGKKTLGRVLDSLLEVREIFFELRK